MKALNSAQRLCRTLLDEPKPIEQQTLKRTRKKFRQPWTPPPEWRALFRAQATHEAIDDVIAYTGSSATWIEHETGRRRPGTVEDIVHDAIADTFAGVVKWKPERCTLAMHLKSAIRTRMSHEIDRADHYRHVRMQDMPDSAATTAIAIDAAPSVSGHKNRFAEEFTAKLRELAAGDEPVLQLVDCYLEGIVERRKVCRATGMTTTTFHNADRRLRRMVEKLPDELRVAALAGMSRDEP